ncbi:hypothetical protein PRIPAC_85032, partial [Pristionchus pacificus]|uniref:CUB domain-containing protein n=1 Tax=Pristionchus pacificus TaxID=54126 RepID=A0A2A6BTF0_PRIPA
MFHIHLTADDLYECFRDHSQKATRSTLSVMKRWFVLFALLHLALSSCPNPGYDLVRDGECRGLEDETTVSFNKARLFLPDLYSKGAAIEAVETCANARATPVIIHNEEHQSYWRSQAAATKNFFLILGLVCNTTTKRYTWADGSQVDFKPSEGYAKDLEGDCSPLYSWYLQSNGVWGIKGGFATGNPALVSIYCTTQLTPPVRSADGCDAFGDDGEDGVCYFVSKFASHNVQAAQSGCMMAGGNLASVHNAQENAFIRRMAVNQRANYGVFIGGSAGKDGNFSWVDGSPMDYENYKPGKFNLSFTYFLLYIGFPKAGAGDCLSLDTSAASGQWSNVDCLSGLPAACMRDQRPVTQPTCVSEGYKENTIIASPGFPFDASTPCDFLLTVDQGRKVQVNILQIEANSCCDHLVLYDGAEGGNVIANLTGGEIHGETFATRQSNVMKVSWQPNGGVNVMGFT